MSDCSTHAFDVPLKREYVCADYIAEDGMRQQEWREEITRCRDCVYICNREYANGLEFHTCSYFDSEHAEVEPDGFCAWASRRDDSPRKERPEPRKAAPDWDTEVLNA